MDRLLDHVRSFAVPRRTARAVFPISIGIVSDVRDVGDLKLKSGNALVCRSPHRIPTHFLIFIFPHLKTTNITNTTNNADKCCITCVRPLTGCARTAHPNGARRNRRSWVQAPSFATALPIHTRILGPKICGGSTRENQLLSL